MPLIQLQHLKALKYPLTRQLPPLPADIEAMRDTATVISFRPAGRKPDQIRKNWHACERFTDVAAPDLVFFGLETDSPLAPLILWDAAHLLPIGGTLLLAGDQHETTYLERDYYRDALTVERKDATGTLLRKVAPLPAEQDKGLDRWSFCIPTGPEDATILNVAVKRILELDIPEKEILLCGRPGANFQYWDKVRIVGEDIVGTPVPICRKKNRLAEEARYENLCILHDRVFLPFDLGRAVRQFGDCFPITTFQSVYFDDKWNAVARRYSDLNRALNPYTEQPSGIMRTSEIQTSPFAPSLSVLTGMEKSHFIYANALRYGKQYYATGSLYLAKRKVWLNCPQHEAFGWTEHEDVEHGYRSRLAGIPTRINPHGMTQSITGRPIVSFGGRVSYESIYGTLKQSAGLPFLSALPRKPLFKFSAEEAYQRQRLFASKYLPAASPRLFAFKTPTASHHIGQIGALTQEAAVPFQQKTVLGFINDFERFLLLDQIPYGTKNWLANQIFENPQNAKTYFLEGSVELMNYASQRPAAGWFYQSLRDYLPRRGLAVYLGTLFSAWRLSRSASGLFYFPGGFWHCYRSLLGNTPFIDYAENTK